MAVLLVDVSFWKTLYSLTTKCKSHKVYRQEQWITKGEKKSRESVNFISVHIVTKSCLYFLQQWLTVAILIFPKDGLWVIASFDRSLCSTVFVDFAVFIALWSAQSVLYGVGENVRFASHANSYLHFVTVTVCLKIESKKKKIAECYSYCQ